MYNIHKIYIKFGKIILENLHIFFEIFFFFLQILKNNYIKYQIIISKILNIRIIFNNIGIIFYLIIYFIINFIY